MTERLAAGNIVSVAHNDNIEVDFRERWLRTYVLRLPSAW